MDHLRRTNILMLFAFLAACALSPQTVNIRPSLDMSEANAIGQGTRITLQVIDNRTSRVIGTRGGVYADTSTISTASDITTPIRGELVPGLRALGYEVVDSGQSAKADLRVLIDAIEYKTIEGRVLTDIETAATVRAVAKVGNREFTGRYRGTQTKEVLRKPSPEDNDELVNTAVSRVLERMLTDRELLEFMRDG
jgi:uncharacterized lipoprotein